MGVCACVSVSDSLGAVFYLIKTGDVEVTCSQLSSSFVPSATGAPDTVSTLSTGMYFGEVRVKEACDPPPCAL